MNVFRDIASNTYWCLRRMGFRIRLVWRQHFCYHIFWRPAKTQAGLAKVCDKCQTVVPLTQAEFYAQFGRFER
jgi:hypothetical protein